MDNVFIPAITDSHICSVDERLLLSLRVKKGGLAIPIFSAVADLEFANSRAAIEKLVEHINNQESTAPVDSEQLNIYLKVRIANTRPGKDEGCLELVINIAIKVRELRPKKREFYDALIAGH